MIRCCLYPYWNVVQRIYKHLQEIAKICNNDSEKLWKTIVLINHEEDGCENAYHGVREKSTIFLLRWFRWLVQFTICEVDYWKVFGNREVHGPKLLTSPIPPNPHCSRDALVQEPEDITHMRDPPKHRPTLGHGCNTNTKIQICILYTQKRI